MSLSRRQLLRTALTAPCAAALAGTAAAQDGEAPAPWNILYISADQHNPLFTSHERHPLARTPNIDRLASQGVRCANTYVATPVCAPTRQSWLTGLYAQEHGQLGNHYALDPRVPSLVQVFRDAGYTTACFGKLHTESAEENGAFGFDVILNQRNREVWQAIAQEYHAGERVEPWYDPHDAPIFDSIPSKIPFKGRVKPHIGFCDDYVLVQEAIRFLRDGLNRPFFAYVSMRLPHYPFDLPQDHYHRYAPEAVGPLPTPERDWRGRPGGAMQVATHRWDTLTPAQTALLTARYLGAVSLIDDLVGLLLDALDRLGLARSTLVIYASDHGDMAGAKGLWLKHVMYEGAARKPFLLRMPGVLKPRREWEGLLNDTDILPTVAGLVGLGAQLPADISGHDRSEPLLDDQEGPAFTFAVDHITPDLQPRMVMVRSRRHKLIHYPAVGTLPASSELYDLLTDPEERENLAGERSQRSLCAELEELAARFLARRRKPAWPLLPLVQPADLE